MDVPPSQGPRPEGLQPPLCTPVYAISPGSVASRVDRSWRYRFRSCESGARSSLPGPVLTHTRSASGLPTVRSGRAQRARRAARNSATSHAGPSAAVPRSQHMSGRDPAGRRSSRPSSASLASTPRIAAPDAPRKAVRGGPWAEPAPPSSEMKEKSQAGRRAGRPASHAARGAAPGARRARAVAPHRLAATPNAARPSDQRRSLTSLRCR
jgi:hypothetical protein